MSNVAKDNDLEANKRLIREFIAAHQKDMPSSLRYFTDDGTWWLPLMGTMDMKQARETTTSAQGQMVTPLELQIHTLTAEENRVAAEIESYVKLKNGMIYNNKYHVLFRIRGGKIYEMKEHNDSHHAWECFHETLTPGK